MTSITSLNESSITLRDDTRAELADVTDADHEFLVELHNDPLVLRNVTDPTPITIESHMRWWDGLNPEKEIRKLFLVGGQRAGFCKFYAVDRNNRNCALGADLHASFRGRGLSYPMWELMLAFSFDVLNVHRVSLTTAEFNTIAQKVYRRLGFRREGVAQDALIRDGCFHDLITMALLEPSYRKLR